MSRAMNSGYAGSQARHRVGGGHGEYKKSKHAEHRPEQPRAAHRQPRPRLARPQLARPRWTRLAGVRLHKWIPERRRQQGQSQPEPEPQPEPWTARPLAGSDSLA